MASIYIRGNKLWARIRDRKGKRAGRPTPYNVGDEAKAKRYADELQRVENSAKAPASEPDPAAPMTVESFARLWLDERRKLGVASVNDDESRLTIHVFPVLGAMRLDEVRPRHVRDLVF